MSETSQKNEIAVFGGGCFWCTEAVFKQLKGVVSVMSGYAGGNLENPTYEKVCQGKTGHAEVVKIEFNPDIISYKNLLIVFFATHDPTTLNRQGNDVGHQYRSIIFYANEEQKAEAENFIKELNETGDKKQIVTELKQFEKFYQAEEEHADYYRNNKNNQYCQLVISPKITKLRERFLELLKLSEK